MPFAKGTPKPPGSGRKKGQACRLAADVRSKLQEMGCDPVEGMARLALDEKQSPELRGSMYAKLSRFCYPELRAVDHNAGSGFAQIIKRVMGVADDAI